MMLLKEELLRKCLDPSSMEKLIDQAELALNKWQSFWSPFISAPLREEAIQLMTPIQNIHWQSDGGHPGAERQMMKCINCGNGIPLSNDSAPIYGIQIEGNFLFDRARADDFRSALKNIGVSSNALGDIWIRGDRGAEALCTKEIAEFLNGKTGLIRDVKITCEAVNKDQLNLPIERRSKQMQCVEASTRIDAIASAGFGLSRAKIVAQIKEGRLRLNWKTIKKTNKELVIGDRIQLEEKGTVKVLSIDPTKRDRWRVGLLRH